jgi:hypothetical protein
MTATAVQYAWRQLVQRAGLSAGEIESVNGGRLLNIPLYYCPLAQAPNDETSLIVVPCLSDQWHGLLDKSADSLHWLPTGRLLPEGDRLRLADLTPVLFWGEGYEDGRQPFVEQRESGTVVFYADILAATFLMLSRWEETVVPIRDEHDRFPAIASVAYKQRFLDRPIVDEYALILRAWLRRLLPNWIPRSRQFTVKVSHDVDSTRRASVSVLAGDLLKRRNIRQAKETAQAFLRPEKDHHWRGIYQLAEWSEQHGLRGSFYFMAAQPDLRDKGYDPQSPLIQRCLADLRQRGHEIGFHPGYRAFEDPRRFMAEKERMDAALGYEIYGGRQHYLRFRAPDTWRQWEQARLTYDSTLSYADHEGFRCGTCHPYHPFDIEQDRQMDLLEVPLIVMDATLKQYRHLTPEAGQECILTLAQRCQQVGGVLTLLWHNNSLLNNWQPWAAMYRQLLYILAEMAT